MKLSQVKDKIDKYFEAITAEEVVKKFESWNIKLIDIGEENGFNITEKDLSY